MIGRAALVALAAAALVAPYTASASVDRVNVQPPTYDHATQTITDVINVERGLFAAGTLYGLDPSPRCDLGVYCYVRDTFYALFGGKQTLTTPCLPDTSGVLHRFSGQAQIGDEGDIINGAVRYFPCF